MPPSSTPPSTILVLASDSKHPIYDSWLSGSPFDVEVPTGGGIDYEFPPHIALAVGSDCYREPWVTLTRRAVEAGIPTLVLADGILEYRNTWEHPGLVPGSLFQPVLGHKIACIGRSQARFIESWGNPTQCEVVGVPRFDRYAGMRRRGRPDGAPFRVLVMTAITPFFTDKQHELVRRSLLDLKSVFKRGLNVGGVTVEPVWRITKGLDKEIGVDSAVTDLSGRQLADVLQNVDAVITTPSTSMLEGMLLGIPVAAIDYCNVPAYVQPSWRIGAAEHIMPTLEELVSPPAPKMLFQDTTLHDALECRTPAAPRMLRLAERMIASGLEARPRGGPPDMSWSLDGGARAIPPAAIGDRFDPRMLYPGHAPFGERDLRGLQVEVSHLRQHAATLERQCRTAGNVSPVSIAWRSKVEAAAVLARLQHRRAAVQLLLDAVKLLESCPHPSVTLEAVVEIAANLAPLDPVLARNLLEPAIKLSEQLGNGILGSRAKTMLTELERRAPKNRQVAARALAAR